MKITNPTSTEIRIGFKGHDYSIPAGETKEVADDLATFWKSIHGFVILSKEETTPVVVVDTPTTDSITLESATTPSDMTEGTNGEEKTETKSKTPKKKGVLSVIKSIK